jgi:hypothetical protein
VEHSRDVEEWAVEAAGEVIAHVERHGLSISWSEAHERVLIEAGRGPMVVAAGDHGEVHSFVNPLGRKHPDFNESVAAAHVHWLGRAFHPLRADSEVPVGVPVGTVVEAMSRLTFLLQLCVEASRDGIETREVAGLVTTLSWHLGDNYLCDLEEGVPIDKIDGSDYLIVVAREIAAAITFLEFGAGLLASADDVAAHLPAPLAAAFLDFDAHRACVLALRWSLGVA